MIVDAKTVEFFKVEKAVDMLKEKPQFPHFIHPKGYHESKNGGLVRNSPKVKGRKVVKQAKRMRQLVRKFNSQKA